MSELLKVYFISSNIRTCFFYRNELDLHHGKSNKFAVKLQFGENYERTSYGSFSQTGLIEVPSKSIGISSLYANRLGLKENEEVLVSYCDVASTNSVEITPKKEEDYVILLSCKSILEIHLLNQIQVVSEGQTLPLYVFTNIVIDVEIGKLSPNSDYGQLEKFTEVIILHPSEKLVKANQATTPTASGDGSHIGTLIMSLNEILKDNTNMKDVQGKNELLHNLFNPVNQLEYDVAPPFMLDVDIPKKVRETCVIVPKFELDGMEGSYCAKVLCKVNKCGQKIPKNDDTNEEEFTYANVISLDMKDTKAYCPPYVMKSLGIYVGDKINLERVTCLPSCQVKRKDFPEDKAVVWDSVAEIRASAVDCVRSNMIHNHRINTLIVGGPGTGKTFLVEEIGAEFSRDFVNCSVIRCKTLRGKKIDTLQKFWGSVLLESSRHEPSLIILDDIHSITYVDEEEGQFNKFYSNRVVDVITNCIKDFQKNYNISVIATSIGMSQLASMVTTHGPRLFQNVQNIPEMTSDDRRLALETILNKKIRNIEVDPSLLEKIANSTNGYTIQDLTDLIDKAVLNCLVRNDRQPSEVDFDQALVDSTPLNLRGVKLKGNIDKTWEDVGGMSEPKKVLTEVFAWPSKYPKLLESCPLRLQRGVLLYGAPGTGKTLLAGALANKCGLNFISVKGPEVLSKYVGASEEGVRNLFLQAQKTKPSLLFFDEFDSLAPKRGHDSTGVTDRVVNQLLTQLDGVETLNGVWVLAATSRPDMIDPALLRPGRLDKLVFCSVPDQEDRTYILEALSRNLPKTEEVDLSQISVRTEGYTGADLQAVLYNAQMLAIKEKNYGVGVEEGLQVQQRHLLKALEETKPSLSEFEKRKYERIYEKFQNSRKKNYVENYTGMTQKITLA